MLDGGCIGETGRPDGLTAEIATPNDPYLRYYSSGYGLSQAFGSHKLLSSIKAPITHQEKMRVMGENLFGAERKTQSATENSAWNTHFKTAYSIEKSQYLAGFLDPNPHWPIDTTNGWFREPQEVNVIQIDPSTVQLSWVTNEPSTSEVVFTNEGVWDYWTQSRIDAKIAGRITNSATVTHHTITISGLMTGAAYKYRIRSHSNQSFPQEVVWGKVV